MNHMESLDENKELLESDFEVGILIVGFRNPNDIHNCLAALSSLNSDPSFNIFVCENGGVEAFEQLCEELLRLDSVCIPARSDLELTEPTDRLKEIRCLALRARPSSRVWVARADENLGYAGAINALLGRLQALPNWQGIWIVNPDTIPDANALAELLERAKSGNKGMVGSTLILLRNEQHNYVQCRGGLHWRKFMVRPLLVRSGESINSPHDTTVIEKSLDGISGASMYVTRQCIDHIGPMDERYFLYYEDLDWGIRAKQYGLGYASNSLVRHKGGTTIGSGGGKSKTSRLSIYLEHRNRVLFVRKHYPWYTPIAATLCFGYSLEYLLAGGLNNFWAANRGVIHGLKGETGRPLDAWLQESHRGVSASKGTARADDAFGMVQSVRSGSSNGRVARRAVTRKERLVLTFHGVGSVPDCVVPGERQYWCEADLFKSLLDSIGSLPRSVLPEITFDDGNISDVTVALPALVDRRLTARFFICAGRIGVPGYLDRSAINEIISANMPIGSHGWGHVDWRNVDNKTLEIEIDGAQKKIADITGRGVDMVSIPFGSYDRRVLLKLRHSKSEIKTVYTSDGGRAPLTEWLIPREVYVTSWNDSTLAKLANRPLGTRKRVSRIIKRLRS